MLLNDAIKFLDTAFDETSMAGESVGAVIAHLHTLRARAERAEAERDRLACRVGQIATERAEEAIKRKQAEEERDALLAWREKVIGAKRISTTTEDHAKRQDTLSMAQYAVIREARNICANHTHAVSSGRCECSLCQAVRKLERLKAAINNWSS